MMPVGHVTFILPSDWSIAPPTPNLTAPHEGLLEHFSWCVHVYTQAADVTKIEDYSE